MYGVSYRRWEGEGRGGGSVRPANLEKICEGCKGAKYQIFNEVNIVKPKLWFGAFGPLDFDGSASSATLDSTIHNYGF